MSSIISFIARFEPEEAKVWKHIPFHIPEGIEQFHINISYNDRIDSSPLLHGGNTLDIGLFDPQGIANGSPGLRGWSGSVRTEITIDKVWATPPYRAGAIQPGEWNLLLGAYKTSANGLDAEVTITLNSNREAPVIPDVPVRVDLQKGVVPKAAEPGWYRGDIHLHTVYSDGDSYPHEVAAAAYEAGLDFYGITDHNRAQSPVPLVPHGNGWPVLVPGVEVTSYAGHFNVWGGSDIWFDFRDYSAAGQQAAVDAAIADGGLVSLNHPKPYGPMWEHPEVTGFQCTEAWNGWWHGLNYLATGYWADQLNEDKPGHWHVGVCGSDTHYLKSPGNPANPLSHATIGHPTLWIHTREELSSDSIISAIRRGDCFLSESPSGPQIYIHQYDKRLEVRVVGAPGDCLMAVGHNGCLRAEAIRDSDETISWSIKKMLRETEPYVRFVVITAGGLVRAMSNPIWQE